MTSKILGLTLLTILVINSTSGMEIKDSRLNIEFKPMTHSDERIRAHGYPAESYFIETPDNYVLKVFRMPYSHHLKNENKYRPAILLQHGLTSNSDCWLANGPDNALAYLLVDAGYDVWLGNARGNIYSRNNTRLSPDNPLFWRFSWHEIGTIDIATMIDFILKETGQDKLHYTGHSQGTTVYLALMSSRPEYNKKIKTAHLLAPCAFFEHGRAAVFEFFAPKVGTPSGIWYNILKDIELVPGNAMINRFVDTLCSMQTPENPFCRTFWFGQGEPHNTNVTAIGVLYETHPGGAAGNQGIHYIQLYVSHRFCLYDYGSRINMEKYGQDTPPDYALGDISAKTYIYSSQNDDLCGPPDVNTLVSHMPTLAGDYRVEDPLWAHGDFITAMSVKEIINDRVIDECNKYEGW